MNGVKEIKALLFEELDLIVRTTAGLLRKIKSDQWDYRPVEQMRTIRELAQHLALVPAVDLLILQEKSEQEVRHLEGEFAEVKDAELLVKEMEEGRDRLKQYMETLGDEEFLRKSTKPFYLEHGAVQAKWLVEIVTHAQHHRAQLFTYLKLLGHEVNMFALY